MNSKKEAESNMDKAAPDDSKLSCSVMTEVGNSQDVSLKDNEFVTPQGYTVETRFKLNIGFSGVKATNLCVNVKAPSVSIDPGIHPFLQILGIYAQG